MTVVGSDHLAWLQVLAQLLVITEEYSMFVQLSTNVHVLASSDPNQDMFRGIGYLFHQPVI